MARPVHESRAARHPNAWGRMRKGQGCITTWLQDGVRLSEIQDPHACRNSERTKTEGWSARRRRHSVPPGGGRLARAAPGLRCRAARRRRACDEDVDDAGALAPLDLL